MKGASVLTVIAVLSFAFLFSVSIHGNQGSVVLSPPQKVIRAPAEWETTSYVLIRWPYDYSGLDSFFLDMTREIAEVCEVKIVVDSQSTADSVSSYLQNNGVNMANVSFFIVTTDSIWIRDYGPISVVDVSSGTTEFINMMYDRFGRWDDDAFPWRYAKANGITWYNMSDGSKWLRLEGGNYMVDGAGIEYSTNRIFEQNDPANGGDLTHDEVVQWMTEYYNLWEFRNVTKMTNDGTGHIDMEIKLLNETTVLISKVDDPSDEDYDILEYNARFFENHTARNGMHYNVIRIPLVKDQWTGTYYTYTNSLIVNNKVLVPIYGISTDSQALQIYRDAMPGYEIVGIDASNIIGMNGAIHCTTMQVAKDNKPPQISVEGVEAQPNSPVIIRVRVTDDTFLKDVYLFYNSSLNSTIKRVKMNPVGQDIYEATLPSFPSGTKINFFVEAEDRDLAVNYSGDIKNPHTVIVGSTPEIPGYAGIVFAATSSTIVYFVRRFS